MKRSIVHGLSVSGELPGGCMWSARHSSFGEQRHIDESQVTRENRLVCAYAFAGRGERRRQCDRHGAYLRRLRRAASALRYMQEQKGFSDEQVLRALAAAGWWGNLIKTNASIFRRSVRLPSRDRLGLLHDCGGAGRTV